MENTEKSEMPEKPKKNSSFKIMAVILALVVAVLAWQLIITKTKVNTFTVEKEKTQLKNISLQQELDSLITEHEKIKIENSSMSGKLTEQDSLITAKADEIQQLIASQADYSRIKKKLEYLRGITQGYVDKIDSLYTVNKVLKEENTEIKDKFEKINYFEAYDMLNLQNLTFDLAELITDIYQDIKDFILLYQKNTFSAQENALLACRRNFYERWGKHITFLMPYLHQILYPNQTGMAQDLFD